MQVAKTLFVSDMDGTLLGTDSMLSTTSARLLNDAIADGALFTVATARTPATVVPLMEPVHARLPFIVIGGAALWDPTRNAFARTRPIAPATVDAIADVFERDGLRPFIYRRHGNVLHTHHFGTMSAQEQRFVEARQGLPLKKFFLDDRDYRDSDDEALLIFSMNKYATLKGIAARIAESADCEITLYHDIFDHDDGYLEIYAPCTTKALAIKQMAEEVGAERVVVFGDNRNDIPMMREATVAVAVANAFDEVKNAANEVIGANTDDSVPRYILAALHK